MLIEYMKEFIRENDKLMLLNLTGCNLGATAKELGDSIHLSRSLQSIHLSFNGIPKDAKMTLFDTIRVNRR